MARPSGAQGTGQQASPPSAPGVNKRQYLDQKTGRYYYFDPVRGRYFWEDGRPRG